MHFTFEMYAAADNRQKSPNLLLWGLRSFKIIDVGTPKKHASIASLYLSATVFTLTSQ